MLIQPIRDEFEAAGAAIGRGPIYPSVTAVEIKDYLASRYDFRKGLPLEEVSRTWRICCVDGRFCSGLREPPDLSDIERRALWPVSQQQLQRKA